MTGIADRRPIPRRAIFWFLQLLGGGGLLMVLATHVCERLHLLPSMGWGLKNSVGHYVDLSSAVLAVTALPIGFLGRRLTRAGADKR